MREDFTYFVDRFADLQVLRFQVPGFEELPLRQREFIYCLYQAALSGRDITWAQGYRHNLWVRATLEALITGYPGDRTEPAWHELEIYTKRVWFSNGIHHHYGQTKFVPGFSAADFARFLRACPASALPLTEGESLEQYIALLEPILFDAEVAAKRVAKDADIDMVRASCVNFYAGVSQEEVLAYQAELAAKGGPKAPSYGLNSTLVKRNGVIEELTWKIDGLYGEAIAQIVVWLERALVVADNPSQAKALGLLVDYYKTGDLRQFDAYNVAWLEAKDLQVDTINGFIETYNDPLDYRGTYEAIVSVVDPIATHRIETIAAKAAFFEANSPIMEEHKKDNVIGISGAVINVVVGAGDANPTSPIGINLPNADWIRESHGSKSVNLANIVDAYAQIKGRIIEEFAASAEEITRAKTYGELADNLHTDLHEVIGHGSGRLMPGVATPKETLRNYSSTLEETRADLVALYYMTDPCLIEFGLAPNEEVGKANYDDFMRNGLLLQLRRLSPGHQLEEDHMRNRQLIANWALVHGGGAVSVDRQDGKLGVRIHDYHALRVLFGKLLREVQRIKSEGDYNAGRELVETYGVKVNPEHHAEVLERFAKLDMAAYSGFQNPVLEAECDAEGRVLDVRISYTGDFTSRMLHYSKHYGFLPVRDV